MQGQLQEVGRIQAKLIAVGNLQAILSDTAHMSGVLAETGRIGCSLTGSEQMTAELTLPKGKASPPYQGDYVVTPKANTETVLPTNGFKMLDDVTVLKIPYYETHGTHGTTIYIANEV